jgi:hypothetical protein
MHGSENVKFANAQQAKQIYINTRKSKKNCTKLRQLYGITKHAGKNN